MHCHIAFVNPLEKVMQPVYRLFLVLLCLTLLGALIVGTYIALWWLVDLFSGLDIQVASVIYAAVVAVLFSTVVISLIVWAGEKRRSLERLRGKKAAVYRRLLAAWADWLYQPTSMGLHNALHMAGELHSAEQQLLLWGSRSVIKHYTAYQKHGTSPEPRHPAVMSLIGKVLLEIPRDLGQSIVGLEPGDMLELWLNDARHGPHSTDTTLQSVPSGHRLFNGVR
jgi:hypothetical protein